MTSKKRLREIDIIRAFAFIFVVIQHSMGGLSYNKDIAAIDRYSLRLFYVVAKPAVPIFLFISGVSLCYVYSKKFNCKDYYIKRLKYVLIPYIAWSAFNMYKLGNQDRFKDFWIQLIAGNGAFHLWYMGGIIRLYILFPIILYISKKIHSMNIKLRIGIFSCVLALYYIVSKYQNLIADKVGLFIFKNPTAVQQRIVNISLLFWFLYFVLGIYVALNYEYIKDKILKHKVVIYIAYFMLLIYAYLNEFDIIPFNRVLYIAYTTVSVLFFYLVSYQLIGRYRVYKNMKYVSDYSFAAYMAHMIVLNKVANSIGGLFNSISYFLAGALTCIVTVILTTIVINLISLMPYSSFITGVKNSKYSIKLNMKEQYSQTA